MYKIGLVASLLLAILPASAAERSIEYGDINAMLDIVKNKTKSPYVEVNTALTLVDESLNMKDIKVWLAEGNDVVTHITVSEDGTIELPVLDEDDAEQTLLFINQEKGAVSLNMSTGIGLPKQTEVSYTELFNVLDDTNTFMSEMAGAASFFMPDMDALKFTFDQPATIEIASKKKRYTFETDDDNEIEIDVSKKLLAENPTLIFSVLPTEVSPED